jgi:hypothetical protein
LTIMNFGWSQQVQARVGVLLVVRKRLANPSGKKRRKGG